LEKIIDIFKELDKNYKEDPKNIERYKRVKSEHENFKLEIIRKRKLNNMRLRQEEKGRKILEYHRKVRFYHLNKNGINLNYFNNSTHYSISSSSKDDLVGKKMKAKREEIKGLLFYN
jgi:site-specific DNA-adenine methylase